MKLLRFFLFVSFLNVLFVPMVQGQGESAAIQKLRRDANAGLALAQAKLGLMYDNGEGVPKDAAQAVFWYRKAAEQGLALAQGRMGVAYIYGEGVPKDLVWAYMWNNIAAAQGVELAQEARDALEADMTSAQIAEAQRLSREWKPKN